MNRPQREGTDWTGSSMVGDGEGWCEEGWKCWPLGLSPEGVTTEGGGGGWGEGEGGAASGIEVGLEGLTTTSSTSCFGEFFLVMTSTEAVLRRECSTAASATILAPCSTRNTSRISLPTLPYRQLHWTALHYNTISQWDHRVTCTHVMWRVRT